MIQPLLFLWMVLLVQDASRRVDDLAWMAGCWRLQAGNRIIDEIWMPPNGGLMLGMSRTVVAGEASAHELMQIRERQGRVVFIAAPAGQPETEFPLVSLSSQQAVFENKAHDFPQRVIYRATADGLLGRIEGTQRGTERGIDFPMRRVRCP